jgi:hypothetical protein
MFILLFSFFLSKLIPVIDTTQIVPLITLSDPQGCNCHHHYYFNHLDVNDCQIFVPEQYFKSEFRCQYFTQGGYLFLYGDGWVKVSDCFVLRTCFARNMSQSLQLMLIVYTHIIFVHMYPTSCGMNIDIFLTSRYTLCLPQLQQAPSSSAVVSGGNTYYCSVGLP